MFSKQRFQTTVFVAAVVAGLTVTSVAVQAAAVVDTPQQSFATANSANDYWTPERMRKAKSLPMPKHEAAELGQAVELNTSKKSKSTRGFKPKTNPVPAARGAKLQLSQSGNATTAADDSFAKGAKGYPHTTGRVYPTSLATAWPYRMAGKVFFRDPRTGRNSSCSGAIIARRLILTAGHCVYNRAGNYFFTNHAFVPAYDAYKSVQPFGVWYRGGAIAPGSWANSSGFPAVSDFAIFAVRDKYIARATRKIGEYLGWFGWQTYRLNGNHIKQLGYPSNLEYGRRMMQTDAYVYRRTSYAGEIGTQQWKGSSGGPWVQDFYAQATGQVLRGSTGYRRIVGVTSYGPSTLSSFNYWQYSGASVLNNAFVGIRNSACNWASGNC